MTLETELRLPSVGSEMTLKKSQKLYNAICSTYGIQNILNKKLILALILTLTVLLQLRAVVIVKDVKKKSHKNAYRMFPAIENKSKTGSLEYIT